MKIENFFIYPIKSCQGIESTGVDLRLTGPQFDRVFVLAHKNGDFLSQRTHPLLACISTSLCLVDGASSLSVNAPGMKTAHPIFLSEDRAHDAVKCRPTFVTIHKDVCPGIDMGDEHAEWFSTFLGEPVRLIRQVKHMPRMRYPNSLGGREIRVSFADAYPLLVTTVESLEDLNDRIKKSGGEDIAMDRFRPNIVLSGSWSYREDEWRTITIGRASLLGADKCLRCVITTIDQVKGTRGMEPLATLSTYRRGRDGGVEFGRNFIVTSPGLITRDDRVTVY